MRNIGARGGGTTFDIYHVRRTYKHVVLSTLPLSHSESLLCITSILENSANFSFWTVCRFWRYVRNIINSITSFLKLLTTMAPLSLLQGKLLFSYRLSIFHIHVLTHFCLFIHFRVTGGHRLKVHATVPFLTLIGFSQARQEGGIVIQVLVTSRRRTRRLWIKATKSITNSF